MTAPAWVQKRDGTLVPFDPDKISRALFAAGESLGQPDAFLARELADGVVHFISAELDNVTPTTPQIAEVVIKVVRELGQPALAQAFADGAWVRARHGKQVEAGVQNAPMPQLVVPYPTNASRDELVAACLRGFSLHEVFARDLVAAHGNGLLRLNGLEAPFELAGWVLAPVASGRGVFEAVAEARRHTAGFIAIDGPEHALAGTPECLPAYVRELRLALESAGLNAVVNVNCAAPPSWAGDVTVGPLFAGQVQAPERDQHQSLTDQLLDALQPAAANVVIDWHLGDGDFLPSAQERLLKVARRAIEGVPLRFVFDRPRHPVALADGLDRQHPAALLAVHLNLPAMAAQLAGQSDAPARFVQKLGSLVRLALSAGVQKRDFLRRRSADRPELARGFLLDRARLVVAPVGLYEAAASLLGKSLAENTDALELARRVVERLRDVVIEDSQSRHLEVCLDGTHLAGIDPPRSAPAVDDQLRVAAALHAVADMGTLSLGLLDGQLTRPEELAHSLRWLWKRSDVTRLRLARAARQARQLTFNA